MRRWCVVFLFLFALLAGYIWESGKYKEKTYANYKEERLLTTSGDVDPQARRGKDELVAGLKEENEAEKKEEKVAYLTFDDGPSEVTGAVLDALDEYGVKATFFVVGKEIWGQREECLKRMVAEGHAVGLHSYSHKQAEIYRSAQAYVEDVLATGQKVEEACGVNAKMYRFPWGSANCYVKGICGEITERLGGLGLVYHDWNVSADDSIGRPTAYSIKHNIEKDFKRYKQPVILMHDSNENAVTAKLLPEIISMIREEGYRFDTLANRERPYQYLNRE